MLYLEACCTPTSRLLVVLGQHSCGCQSFGISNSAFELLIIPEKERAREDRELVTKVLKSNVGLVC